MEEGTAVVVPFVQSSFGEPSLPAFVNYRPARDGVSANAQQGSGYLFTYNNGIVSDLKRCRLVVDDD